MTARRRRLGAALGTSAMTLARCWLAQRSALAVVLPCLVGPPARCSDHRHPCTACYPKVALGGRCMSSQGAASRCGSASRGEGARTAMTCVGHVRPVGQRRSAGARRGGATAVPPGSRGRSLARPSGRGPSGSPSWALTGHSRACTGAGERLPLAASSRAASNHSEARRTRSRRAREASRVFTEP